LRGIFIGPLKWGGVEKRRDLFRVPRHWGPENCRKAMMHGGVDFIRSIIQGKVTAIRGGRRRREKMFVLVVW
jgi:hypothetical protein